MIILLIRLHQNTQVHVITNVYKTKHKEREEERGERVREELREEGGRVNNYTMYMQLLMYTHK